MFRRLSFLTFFIVIATCARAQYYELANQLTNLISPALSGSATYRGYVDLTGTAGIGTNRANFVGISTSQGFQYAPWFFMGAGIGIDVAMARGDDAVYETSGYYGSCTTKTQAMLPVFSDFRFNIGSAKSSSFFIDLKIGAAWFLGSKYLEMTDFTMGHGAQFFLRPTVGLRIPVNAANTKQAFNIGVSYQLLTSNNNYRRNGASGTLSAFGATIGFEW